MAPKDLFTQQAFLSQVKDLASPGISLADELSDLLGISTDSVYRRLRGETALSIDETAMICRHFHIPPESIISASSGTVTFEYQSFGNQIVEFGKYLEDLRHDLRRIKQVPGMKIIYAAEDIPFFHHFQFKETSGFKMYYWMRSLMNVDSLQSAPFSIDLIPEDYYEMGKEILDLYYQIPSVEIWSDQTVSSILKQIRFCADSGMFSTKEAAIAVCDQLLEEMSRIQKKAESGSKLENREDSNPNFFLYFSEIEIGNNCIYVSDGQNARVYLRHFTFNYLKTSNPAFCQETHEWLDYLIRKSIPLSGVSEKHRTRFFMDIRNSIEELKKTL
ncbi:MAG: hypothetical protein KKA07_03290 [Bacteroidetes bacterium]|nr:hypothetical protein [Bacteroidota bacterium]